MPDYLVSSLGFFVHLHLAACEVIRDSYELVPEESNKTRNVIQCTKISNSLPENVKKSENICIFKKNK